MKIGVTGNIGSGKTMVCNIFESMDIPVIYADALAKELMRSRLHIRNYLITEFGTDCFYPNGQLNKDRIAQIIFSSKSKRTNLEKVVHPCVHEYLTHWFDAQSGPYAIEEAALIYESGSDSFLDKVIFVHCPLEIRMQRVMKRDNINKKQFMSRESSQWPEEEKMIKADFIIHNKGEDSLIKQIRKIHHQLIKI